MQEKAVDLSYLQVHLLLKYFAEELRRTLDGDRFTIGAIGHVTEKRLLKVGATVHVKPETYTLKALVEKLANRKDVDRE